MNNKDSLISNFVIEEVVKEVAKYKVTFTVVNGKELVYFTNSEAFLENLKKFKDKKFLIEYSFSELSKKSSKNKKEETETKIVRVRLPKTK